MVLKTLGVEQQVRKSGQKRVKGKYQIVPRNTVRLWASWHSVSEGGRDSRWHFFEHVSQSMSWGLPEGVVSTDSWSPSRNLRTRSEAASLKTPGYFNIQHMLERNWFRNMFQHTLTILFIHFYTTSWLLNGPFSWDPWRQILINDGINQSINQRGAKGSKGGRNQSCEHQSLEEFQAAL